MTDERANEKAKKENGREKKIQKLLLHFVLFCNLHTKIEKMRQMDGKSSSEMDFLIIQNMCECGRWRSSHRCVAAHTLNNVSLCDVVKYRTSRK